MNDRPQIQIIHEDIIPAVTDMLVRAGINRERAMPQSAVAALLAVGLQESHFDHRVQMGGGPAHGFWQFEKGGGVRGVLNHPRSKFVIQSVCQELCEVAEAEACYQAIIENDHLACAFARLLMWTATAALPERNDPDGAWEFYVNLWRPGKPHRETWDAYYAEAWGMV